MKGKNQACNEKIIGSDLHPDSLTAVPKGRLYEKERWSEPKNKSIFTIFLSLCSSKTETFLKNEKLQS